MEGEEGRLTFHDFELYEFYAIHMYYLYLKYSFYFYTILSKKVT